MTEKFKQFIYLFFSVVLASACFAQRPSPLSPKVWQEVLKQGPDLGETGTALIGIAQRDPLFFGDLVPRVLKEGFTLHPNNFASINLPFLIFVSQEFEIHREAGFRQGILALAPLMPVNLQEEFSGKELTFLLDASPKESHLRTREIQLWIRLTKPLSSAKQAFLMLYAKTEDPAVRHFLLQAAESLVKTQD